MNEQQQVPVFTSGKQAQWQSMDSRGLPTAAVAINVGEKSSLKLFQLLSQVLSKIDKHMRQRS